MRGFCSCARATATNLRSSGSKLDNSGVAGNSSNSFGARSVSETCWHLSVFPRFECSHFKNAWPTPGCPRSLRLLSYSFSIRHSSSIRMAPEWTRFCSASAQLDWHWNGGVSIPSASTRTLVSTTRRARRRLKSATYALLPPESSSPSRPVHLRKNQRASSRYHRRGLPSIHLTGRPLEKARRNIWQLHPE